MRQAKVPEARVFERLTTVFREKGYEGASYADLMKATGLVKASLYHRFPGGKEEMVDAILCEVDRHFGEYVLAPAYEKGEPVERARRMAKRIAEFYAGGQRWCLLDTLGLTESKRVKRHMAKSLAFWVESFARVSREAGIPAREARVRAEDAIGAIEGGLVVARVSANPAAFRRVISGLAERLTRARPRFV
jgi:AcrR family transcriptional regulator